ncbi:hypothetical protein PHYBLDRAFT_153099 [Phycomyces blakesleeanus NRRL 1555(-)]|uniref:Uncharacterized protein n=1 Tax=Phycomyces blakesleeanus (strain ATCC 8743b / DSM 1359 / FGSC 10004 / NBRC 33097 / NRRL 1555) TaxID=763407 RepID=A0A162ZCF2_PHYB8|nr:hypothetical protein PHYBLDRAFT_153099 [Phycomyces blakesleeanus NRRL 1555(-)]OAD65841.1 hypothetical protein PHYBLDRAFT_153099 [Phycomyces blakesleeanus NRRL 1555(-)]|eukprot:XP_018283881.1 hypothetical protein PHYBLDRAFT_153099 [Phycomyces blakesleeanus NRRL 1555(-)]
MNFLERSTFIDESGFDINARPPSGWSVKNKVKRSIFDENGGLIARKTEAYNSVPPKHLRAFV